MNLQCLNFSFLFYINYHLKQDHKKNVVFYALALDTNCLSLNINLKLLFKENIKSKKVLILYNFSKNKDFL